jgi:branched-chain amino acid transport system ATP-binding protein
MANPLLEGRDLHTYYGQSHILRGVTFAIAPGETVGLMGRNGMGKSTLIRTLMGLVPPAKGSIHMDGQDVTGTVPFRMAQAGIAYVPEGRGIFATLSVRENLEIAARPGTDGKVAWTPKRVLELFPRLQERITNRGDQLSGGEQQMLSVGRALTTNPRLLILDEATERVVVIVKGEIVFDGLPKALTADAALMQRHLGV